MLVSARTQRGFLRTPESIPETLKECPMKAKVDETLCCACGPCEEICPQVFKIGPEVAVVIVDVVPPEAEAACREAMENCPTSAISIEE